LSSQTGKSAQSFIISALASGAFAALPAQAAIAATVTLDNGDQITGELLQLSNATSSFKSSLFGDVKISWNQVGMRASDDGLRIMTAGSAAYPKNRNQTGKE
jgi:hypothetical protein